MIRNRVISIRIIALLVFAIFTSSYLQAQGGWDIGYIFQDSISASEIELEVKVDFISRDRKLSQSKHPINFLSKEDTSLIVLCGNDTLRFVEKRNIHSDWGFYNEQYLESANYLNDENIRLRTTKFVIREVQTDSIYFELHASIFRIRKKKEYNLGNKMFMFGFPEII